MTELDIQAQKDYAVKETLAEGKAEGKAERDLEIARNMLMEGTPLDFICRVTGLTKDAISAMK